LAEEAQPDFGVAVGEVEAANEAAEFFLGEGGGVGVQVFAIVQDVEEQGGEALEAGGCSGGLLLGGAGGGLGAAGQFVHADGYGLAEIYGAVRFAGGDAQEPVAVAEVFVG